MKLFALPLALLSSLFIAPATADFFVYKQMLSVVGDGGPIEGWTVFDGSPSCRDVRAGPWWVERDDVSGTKLGVRCEGNGCASNNPRNVDVLEMHFTHRHPIYHWSQYLNYPSPANHPSFPGRETSLVHTIGSISGHIVLTDSAVITAVYKDRDWDMVSTFNGKYGECRPDQGDDFYCTTGLTTYSGARYFRCRSKYTARQIRSGKI